LFLVVWGLDCLHVESAKVAKTPGKIGKRPNLLLFACGRYVFLGELTEG